MEEVIGDCDAESKAQLYTGASLRTICTLHEAVPELPAGALLHAGPAYSAGSTLPTAVRNAAAHALVFEGRAADQAEALDLLAGGSVTLAPAQDFGVVTPLSQVVSGAMPVFVVGDETRQAYAPLVEGPPPALRFGSADPRCVSNLRDQSKRALTSLRTALEAGPVPTAPLIVQALRGGDECHSRTALANEALFEHLTDIPAEYLNELRASQGFVLPVLMAASAWVLGLGRGEIEAAGGNGVEFGIKRTGESEWICIPAQPPIGPFFPGKEREPVLGAIGDSAVIDFCGLGGQALTYSPELVKEWRELLPEDWASRSAVLDPDSGLVSLMRSVSLSLSPIVHLAMVGAGPEPELLGRGFYQPSSSDFECALGTLVS